MPDDAQLDKVSRQLLADLDEVKALEQKKRRMTRSSREFHETAKEIERAARHVFEHAQTEEQIARDDSPIPEERDSTEPGDWTRQRDN